MKRHAGMTGCGSGMIMSAGMTRMHRRSAPELRAHGGFPVHARTASPWRNRRLTCFNRRMLMQSGH